MLSNSGRLKLSLDVAQWVGHALERFIVASALERDAPVVTGDQRISAWGQVETIW